MRTTGETSKGSEIQLTVLHSCSFPGFHHSQLLTSARQGPHKLSILVLQHFYKSKILAAK